MEIKATTEWGPFSSGSVRASLKLGGGASGLGSSPFLGAGQWVSKGWGGTGSQAPYGASGEVMALLLPAPATRLWQSSDSPVLLARGLQRNLQRSRSGL